MKDVLKFPPASTDNEISFSADAVISLRETGYNSLRISKYLFTNCR